MIKPNITGLRFNPKNNFIFKDSNLITGKNSHLKELRKRNIANEIHLKELHSPLSIPLASRQITIALLNPDNAYPVLA